MRHIIWGLLALVALQVSPVRAEPLRLAVAANFAAPAEELAQLFLYQGLTDEKPEVTLGASGQLAAQLIKGAPWDLFFSADTDRIRRMQAYDLVRDGEMRVYARGRLVFWQPKATESLPLAQRLQQIKPVAIANERLAPYGRAAFSIVQKLAPDLGGLNLVRGQSVAQTHAMITSGAAPGGFIALSQVEGECAQPTCILLPVDQHPPIEQGVAVMARSRNRDVALQFYAFLTSNAARAVIRRYGYLDGDSN